MSHGSMGAKWVLSLSDGLTMVSLSSNGSYWMQPSAPLGATSGKSKGSITQEILTQWSDIHTEAWLLLNISSYSSSVCGQFLKTKNSCIYCLFTWINTHLFPKGVVSKSLFSPWVTQSQEHRRDERWAHRRHDQLGLCFFPVIAHS